MCAFPSSNAEDPCGVLCTAERTVEAICGDRGAAAKVPPSDLFVFAGGGDDVRVFGRPDDGFDGALVDPWPDFIGWDGLLGGTGRGRRYGSAVRASIGSGCTVGCDRRRRRI